MSEEGVQVAFTQQGPGWLVRLYGELATQEEKDELLEKMGSLQFRPEETVTLRNAYAGYSGALGWVLLNTRFRSLPRSQVEEYKAWLRDLQNYNIN